LLARGPAALPDVEPPQPFSSSTRVRRRARSPEHQPARPSAISASRRRAHSPDVELALPRSSAFSPCRTRSTTGSLLFRGRTRSLDANAADPIRSSLGRRVCPSASAELRRAPPKPFAGGFGPRSRSGERAWPRRDSFAGTRARSAADELIHGRSGRDLGKIVAAPADSPPRPWIRRVAGGFASSASGFTAWTVICCVAGGRVRSSPVSPIRPRKSMSCVRQAWLGADEAPRTRLQRLGLGCRGIGIALPRGARLQRFAPRPSRFTRALLTRPPLSGLALAPPDLLASISARSRASGSCLCFARCRGGVGGRRQAERLARGSAARRAAGLHRRWPCGVCKRRDSARFWRGRRRPRGAVHGPGTEKPLQPKELGSTRRAGNATAAELVVARSLS
jgi:hypothetical protein